jgi:hypothetical protein
LELASGWGRNKAMKDLTSPIWIKLKGLLFLLLGIFAALLLVLELPSAKVITLLCLSIWCFCRFYYFAFYVIEHCVDPSFRFSGLWNFAAYLWHTRKGTNSKP